MLASLALKKSRPAKIQNQEQNPDLSTQKAKKNMVGTIKRTKGQKNKKEKQIKEDFDSRNSKLKELQRRMLRT